MKTNHTVTLVYTLWSMHIAQNNLKALLCKYHLGRLPKKWITNKVKMRGKIVASYKRLHLKKAVILCTDSRRTQWAIRYKRAIISLPTFKKISRQRNPLAISCMVLSWVSV